MIGSNFDPQLVATAKQTIQEFLSLNKQSDPSTIQSKTTQLAQVIIKLLGTGISTHTYSRTQEISPEASMLLTRILTDIGNVQQSATQPTNSQPNLQSRAITLSPLDKLQTKIQRLQQLINKSFKIQSLNEFGDINENNIDAYLITIGELRGLGDIEVPLLVAASITDGFKPHEPALNLAKTTYELAKERFDKQALNSKQNAEMQQVSKQVDAVFLAMNQQKNSFGISWQVQHYCQATVLYDNGFNSIQVASAKPVMQTASKKTQTSEELFIQQLVQSVLNLNQQSDLLTVQSAIKTLSQFITLGLATDDIDNAPELGMFFMRLLVVIDTLESSFPKENVTGDFGIFALFDDTSIKPQFDMQALSDLQTKIKKFQQALDPSFTIQPLSVFEQSLSAFEVVNENNIDDYLMLLGRVSNQHLRAADFEVHQSIALTAMETIQANQRALKAVQEAYEVAQLKFNFAVRTELSWTGMHTVQEELAGLNRVAAITPIMQKVFSKAADIFEAMHKNSTLFATLRQVRHYCQLSTLYDESLVEIETIKAIPTNSTVTTTTVQQLSINSGSNRSSTRIPSQPQPQPTPSDSFGVWDNEAEEVYFDSSGMEMKRHK